MIITPQEIKSKIEIAIVVSRFNSHITEKLLEGALARFTQLGLQEKQITVVWVPGAVEIPILAQQLARKNRYSAIIALGAVIYGETKHFDYVCDQVCRGCHTVSLSCEIPVIFGVLTTLNDAQARARVGGDKGHMGIEAANAAYQTVSVMMQVQNKVDAHEGVE